MDENLSAVTIYISNTDRRTGAQAYVDVGREPGARES